MLSSVKNGKTAQSKGNASLGGSEFLAECGMAGLGLAWSVSCQFQIANANVS
jgi:hypothetical protein